MAVRLKPRADKLKRARLSRSRARARTGTRYPSALDSPTSAVVDVNVDLVRNVDVRSAEAELAAEHVQQHQHDDDQQDNGENATAAATAIAGLHYGRVLALGLVAII